MFGAKLYELKEQQLEEEKKNNEEEKKRKLEQAKKRIEIIKKDLEERANKGKTLEIEITHYFDEVRAEIKTYFDKLRELGWEDGISIYEVFNTYPVEYRASIENLFQNKSLHDYIYKNQEIFLTNAEDDYIQKEEKYFNQLLDGRELYYIYERDTDFREKPLYPVAAMALANAAYRIGLEGEIVPFDEEGIIIKAEPTYSKVIDSSKMNYERYENYIEIMHRYYKEKREQDSQVPKQKGKNPKEG